MYNLFFLGSIMLVLLFCCVSAQGQAAKTVNVPMYVEHDAWSARCEDDAKIPGGNYFGIGYGRLTRPFTPGHRYRISGTLGWSFLLTLDANGNYDVSDVQAGPHLAKAPLVQIDTTDPELKDKKPVEVLFGRVPEFSFTVPVDYLGWEIPGVYALRTGNRQVELPDGVWEMHGAGGWVLPLVVSGGKLALTGSPTGLDRAAVRIMPDALELLPPLRQNRVTIEVPRLLGAYTLQTITGISLLPPATGAQTVNLLPMCMYKLKGSDWSAELTVSAGKAEAQLPPATFGGTVTVDNQQLLPCRQGVANIATRLGTFPLQLPDKATGATALGIGWSPDNQAVLLVCVKPATTGWHVTARFLRGGGKEWAMTVGLQALDQASPYTPPAPIALPAEGVDLPKPALAPSGAYALTVEAAPPQSTDVKARCRVETLVTHNGQPAVSFWFAMNRTAYREDEPIEICAWQAGKPRALTLQVSKVVNDFHYESLFRTAVSGNGLYTIPADQFPPGDFQLELLDGNPLTSTAKATVLARRALHILPAELPTHFYLDAYGMVQTRPEQVELLNSLGLQAFSEQGGTNVLNERRMTGLANGLAALAEYLPEVGPASRYAEQGNRFLDHLDMLGWKLFAQWSCAHQPYAYGMTFTDPVIVNRVKMTSLWAAQYGRQHPSFLGINMFDEGGTPRGVPRMSDDASYLEYDAFARQFGRPRPRFAGEDDEAARAWIYDKQRQHNVIYSATGDRLAEINALADPASHLYLGTQNGNLNSMAVDGGHPPIAYQAITLSSMHWYAGYIYTCFAMMGNEFNFMQPKPIEFFPLIWGDGHHDLTRHEVSLVISRQVDGVGYFHDRMFTDPMLSGVKGNEDEVKECQQDFMAQHLRLTRYGDFLRAVRRDRKQEVAVLYSLYDLAPRLLVDKVRQTAPYIKAFKATYTDYLVMTGCLRAGIQAGVVCEEEILQKDGLAGRKALIIPGMRVLKPGMAERLAAFIAGGGTVFTDAGTTVAIPGARALKVDFAALVDKADLQQVLPEGKPTKVKIDRVVLDELLPALEPVKEIVHPVVRLASTDLLVTRQVNGQAVYYYCVNDHIKPLAQLPAPLNEYVVQDYHLPLETQLTLLEHGVVYDVFAGKELGSADGLVLPVKLRAGDLALYAVLPEAVGGMSVTVAKPRDGNTATLTVQVFGQSHKLLLAAVPLEIHLLDSGGNDLREVVYRSTSNGYFTMPLRLGAFDPPAVQVTVRELLSGKNAKAEVHVTPTPRTLTIHQAPVIVENGKALEHFVRAQKRLIVALGDGPGSFTEAEVQPLVKALRSHGIAIEVRHTSELIRKGFDNYIGHGVARTSEPVYGMPVPGYEVDAPVLAVGASENNALIRWVVQEHNFTRYGDRGFPGPGRAYLAQVWQPFSLTDDAALLIAEDHDGLQQGMKWIEKVL